MDDFDYNKLIFEHSNFIDQNERTQRFKSHDNIWLGKIKRISLVNGLFEPKCLPYKILPDCFRHQDIHKIEIHNFRELEKMF